MVSARDLLFRLAQSLAARMRLWELEASVKEAVEMQLVELALIQQDFKVDDRGKRVANLERQLVTAKQALRLCQHELEATQDELAASLKLNRQLEVKLEDAERGANARSLALSRQLMAELEKKERTIVELEEARQADRLSDETGRALAMLRGIIRDVEEAKLDLEYARRENILFGALFDTELSSYNAGKPP
eukprot:768744-Hanusia_phi.AAC.2